MMIVNFILFLGCMFTFVGFFITLALGAPWISFFFFVLFCLGYYAFRLNPNNVRQPKEVIITYRNGDLQKEVREEDEDDGLPDFNRANWKFN